MVKILIAITPYFILAGLGMGVLPGMIFTVLVGVITTISSIYTRYKWHRNDPKAVIEPRELFRSIIQTDICIFREVSLWERKIFYLTDGNLQKVYYAQTTDERAFEVKYGNFWTGLLMNAPVSYVSVSINDRFKLLRGSEKLGLIQR